jgi:hypothetical protein
VKTLIVECKFVIEVPWEEDLEHPEYSSEDHIRFYVEENHCCGTGSIGSALDDLMEVADKNSICWACAVGGENKLLAIEDREPRDYAKEIQFTESKTEAACVFCGAIGTETVKKNASIVERRFECAKCKSHSSSMEMGLMETKDGCE